MRLAASSQMIGRLAGTKLAISLVKYPLGVWGAERPQGNKTLCAPLGALRIVYLLVLFRS